MVCRSGTDAVANLDPIGASPQGKGLRTDPATLGLVREPHALEVRTSDRVRLAGPP